MKEAKMSKIEEMALKDLPVDINKHLGFDVNEFKREGYIIGANAMLKELEDFIRHSSFGDVESAILNWINEQKNR